MTSKQKQPVVSREWQAGAASSSEEACIALKTANVRGRAATLRGNRKTESLRPGEAGYIEVDGDNVTAFTGSGFITDRYVCLPDTIDPRGSKGSGR